MVSRLSASDASFYRLNNTTTPMYGGALLILQRPRAGLSYEKLLATVEQRLPQVPRYRQRVRQVTMNLARPGSTTSSPGFSTAIRQAVIASVAPEVTTTSLAQSISRP